MQSLLSGVFSVHPFHVLFMDFDISIRMDTDFPVKRKKLLELRANN